MAARAVIDRLIHHGSIFEFSGESHRLRSRTLQQSPKPAKLGANKALQRDFGNLDDSNRSSKSTRKGRPGKGSNHLTTRGSNLRSAKVPFLASAPSRSARPCSQVAVAPGHDMYGSVESVAVGYSLICPAVVIRPMRLALPSRRSHRAAQPHTPFVLRRRSRCRRWQQTRSAHRRGRSLHPAALQTAREREFRSPYRRPTVLVSAGAFDAPAGRA